MERHRLRRGHSRRRAMKITLITPVLILLLSACGQQDAPAEDTAPAPPPATAQPAATEGPAYVGRWAANEGLCDDGAWTFERDGLSTAGEVSCGFDGVAALDDGYEIAATCTAEAPPEPHNLRLTFGSDGSTMVVRGGPFAEPPPLIRCAS